MIILHTEASLGWGGQEIRILQEAEGMRSRGHEIFFATGLGAKLAERAREKKFVVYEIPLTIRTGFFALYHLITIIRKHSIEVINTHSSADSWIGGIAGRLTQCKVIRTRHLSTQIRPGLNSRLLYHHLADYTITTCEAVAKTIQNQANIPSERCQSIPTGVDPAKIVVSEELIQEFRQSQGYTDDHCVIGTVCVLRSWKGITHLLQAAKLLENEESIRWLIVGDGPCYPGLMEQCQKLNLQDKVTFTGQLENPFHALASMDIFMLLSTANEGVSQASLQAAYLKKPIIATTVGGLPEVCIHGRTGYTVSPNSPDEVAKYALALSKDPQMQKDMGKNAHELAINNFSFDKTLDSMEAVYYSL